MPWWLWILLGLGLLGLEILTPGGFYLVFFGIAAVVVGALAAADLARPVWSQWLAFSVFSIVSLLLFRGRLVARLRSQETPAVDALEGEVATLLDDLAPGGIGRAELRGASWTAQNDGDHRLRRGQRCRVKRVEGLTLLVRAD